MWNFVQKLHQKVSARAIAQRHYNRFGTRSCFRYFSRVFFSKLITKYYYGTFRSASGHSPRCTSTKLFTKIYRWVHNTHNIILLQRMLSRIAQKHSSVATVPRTHGSNAYNLYVKRVSCTGDLRGDGFLFCFFAAKTTVNKRHVPLHWASGTRSRRNVDNLVDKQNRFSNTAATLQRWCNNIYCGNECRVRIKPIRLLANEPWRVVRAHQYILYFPWLIDFIIFHPHASSFAIFTSHLHGKQYCEVFEPKGIGYETRISHRYFIRVPNNPFDTVT